MNDEHITIIWEPVVALDDWMDEAIKLRQEFAIKYGTLPFSVGELIHEMREERMESPMATLNGKPNSVT